MNSFLRRGVGAPSRAPSFFSGQNDMRGPPFRQGPGSQAPSNPFSTGPYGSQVPKRSPTPWSRHGGLGRTNTTSRLGSSSGFNPASHFGPSSGLNRLNTTSRFGPGSRSNVTSQFGPNSRLNPQGSGLGRMWADQQSDLPFHSSPFGGILPTQRSPPPSTFQSLFPDQGQGSLGEFIEPANPTDILESCTSEERSPTNVELEAAYSMVEIIDQQLLEMDQSIMSSRFDYMPRLPWGQGRDYQMAVQEFQTACEFVEEQKSALSELQNVYDVDQIVKFADEHHLSAMRAMAVGETPKVIEILQKANMTEYGEEYVSECWMYAAMTKPRFLELVEKTGEATTKAQSTNLNGTETGSTFRPGQGLQSSFAGRRGNAGGMSVPGAFDSGRTNGGGYRSGYGSDLPSATNWRNWTGKKSDESHWSHPTSHQWAPSNPWTPRSTTFGKSSGRPWFNSSLSRETTTTPSSIPHPPGSATTGPGRNVSFAV